MLNKKKQSVLFLSPHPDDLELSAALLCIKLRRKFQLIEVVLTNGAMGGIAKEIIGTKKLIKIRKNESLASARILKIKKVIFLDYPDKNLKNKINHATCILENIVKEHNVKMLCFPSSYDQHSDHLATNFIAKNILNKRKDIIDLQYCFWGNNKLNNIKISLLRSSRTKKSAIYQHKSQKIDEYLSNNKDILKKELFYSKRIFYIKNKIKNLCLIK